MGQQQLLLLLLAIVVVGVAVIVGIQGFQVNMRKNQADDVLNQNVRIAQEAVNWRGRSVIHGGGGGGTYAPLATDGFTKLQLDASTGLSQHAILTANATTVEVVGVSEVSEGVGAYVRLVGNTIVETRVSLDGGISLTDAGGDAE